MEPTAIDPRRFRDAIGRFATGVTVVTAAAGGQVRGMTANAVSSLSLEPMLLLVCVQRTASAHAMIEQAGVFAVNILAADQRPLAELFARAGEFDAPMGGVPFHSGSTGAPLLAGALASIECTLHERLAGGDHSIFIGRVVDLVVARPTEQPLLFFSGAYREIAPA